MVSFKRPPLRWVWSRADLRGASALLPIAPSTYYAYEAREADPTQLPRRAKRDESLAVEIQRVWRANRSIYGARKVWRQLKREGFGVARCTAERLIRRAGLEGVDRGKRVRSTIPSDLSSEKPLDLVQRLFRAEQQTTRTRHGSANSGRRIGQLPTDGEHNRLYHCRV